MSTTDKTTAIFKVLDAMDHPHGGRILRLRLQEGDAPAVRALRNARLRGTSPGGEDRIVKVDGFASFGGKPSDDRLARTGRADLLVYGDDGKDAPDLDVGWTVSGPLS